MDVNENVLDNVLRDDDIHLHSGSENVPSVGEALDDLACFPLNMEDEKKEPEGRKRMRHEENWKKNVRKAKKTKGEHHINSVGKAVSGKRFEPVTSCCKEICFNKIKEEHQKQIFGKYYALSCYDEQRAYIFSQVKIKPVARHYQSTTPCGKNKSKNSTRFYYLPNEEGVERQVCKTFFKKVLLISDGQIDRTMKTKSNITPPIDQRGRHTPWNRTSEDKVSELCEFINSFPSYESHYALAKTKRMYLAPDLNIRKMFAEYKDKVASPASEHLFRFTFNTKFNLHFHPPITDSRKKCDCINNKMKSIDDKNELLRLKTELELHQRKATKARNSMQNHSQVPLEDDDTTVIAFDLMKTLPTPVLSTGITYYKRQLWTYCLGVHNLRSGSAVMFLWDESIASRGPEEIASCLLAYLKKYVTTRKVIMYSDAAGGQNRNIKMALFCNLVTQSSEYSVTHLEHNFLISGHSYLLCDADFGLIEKNKKYFKNIFVPENWIDVIKSARKKSPFLVHKLDRNEFFSIKDIQKKCVTNRKIAMDESKVEWLKIVNLTYNEASPFIISYSYGYGEGHTTHCVDVKKRLFPSTNEWQKLPLLYPQGNAIADLKKKDLMVLMKFVPPIHHNFYNNLKVSSNVSEKIIPLVDEDVDD